MFQTEINIPPSVSIIAIGQPSFSLTTRTSNNGRLFAEALVISEENTLPSLTRMPLEATTLKLFVNGIAYHSFGGTEAFFAVNLGTKELEWSAANAGFSIMTGDRVVVEYLVGE